MRKFYRLDGERLAPTEESQAQVVLIINPDPATREELIHQFDFDPHNIQSAMDIDELARIEYEDNHTAIICKKPKSYTADDQFQFKVSSLGIFLFPHQVVVLSDAELPLIDDRRYFAKVKSLKTFVLRLLNFSVVHFTEHLKIINRISDELEQKIESSMKNEYLLYMFSLGKGLTYYLNAINSNDLLLRRMQMSRVLNFDEDEQEMLEDLMIENKQCLRQAEIYSNILSSMMDARASIVSNNLNILMKSLNIITVAIMVPTFVVSAFSMNVPIPLQKESWAFWLVMGFAVVSVGIFYTIYKKRRWYQ